MPIAPLTQETRPESTTCLVEVVVVASAAAGGWQTPLADETVFGS